MRETLRTAVIREILLSLRSFVGDCVSSSTTSTFARLLKDLPELSQLLDVLKGYWLGAMSGPRRHFVMGLVLLLCALTGRSVCAPSAALPTGYAQQRGEKEDYRQLMEAIRHADETKSRSSARGDAPITSRSRIFALEARDSRSPRTDRREPVPTFPRNSKKKGKFLQHMTGPLYFSHRCRKHAYRLYHQTRDCTIPAYYKRCARLLTRLAGSPQCMEG